MDACGSPECRFLSGAQHTTETSLACYNSDGEKELANTDVVVCLAWVINKMAPCGKRGVTYQSLYKSITPAQTNISSSLRLTLPWLMMLRLPDFNHAEVF